MRRLLINLLGIDIFSAVDALPRYIMICCYKPLFCPYTTPDEEEDLMIQGKIRSLNWVTAAHLECPFKETAPEVKLQSLTVAITFNQKVRDVIYTAINDILEVDGLKCPQDKLGSVVSCSKKVFEVLQVCTCERNLRD